MLGCSLVPSLTRYRRRVVFVVEVAVLLKEGEDEDEATKVLALSHSLCASAMGVRQGRSFERGADRHTCAKNTPAHELT